MQEENNEQITMIKKKRYRLKKFHFNVVSRLIFLVIPFFVFLSMAFVFLYKALNYVDVYQLFYNENSNLDYVVCLKPNTYFSETCLDKDNLYIANIIDYINVEFKYNLNTSDIIDYDYKYNITASMIATEKGDVSNKKLYSSEEVLLEEKNGNSNNNNFEIDEKIKIDYSKYNELMTAFRKDYVLLLNSNLNVILHLEINGKYKNIDEPIVIKQDLALTIPLSEQTLNIGVDYNNINKQEMININVKDQKTLIIYYISLAISSVLSFILLIKIALFLKKIKNPKSNYTKELEKIMREYNQIISETKKIPDTSKYKMFELKSFSELLDVRETLLQPIIYTKINSGKSWFIITNGEEMYRFILKEADLEK